jgi:hypothetical protein
MPGQAWLWIAALVVIQMVVELLPRAWAVRGQFLSVLATLVVIGFAISGRAWLVIPVVLVLAVSGVLVRLSSMGYTATAGEFQPVRATAAEVDDAIRRYLDEGRSTLTLEVEPTGALYVLTHPKHGYYSLRDECPHCFVERYLGALLSAEHGPIAVLRYRESIARGRTPVAAFRLFIGCGWMVVFQRQLPWARAFRPVQCARHGPRSGASDP